MLQFGIARFKTTIRTQRQLSMPVPTTNVWPMPPGLDTSPPVHRWMKDSLDRSAFHKSLPVLGVRLPAQKTTSILKSEQLKKYIMDLPKIKTVIWDPSGEPSSRIILLKVEEEVALPLEARSFLQEQCVDLIQHKIDLNYDYWTADDIITSILPEELCDGSPTGFSITGHIAHMNLNEEYLPYKHLIGQIILDKNPSIKTVVNKLDSIDTKFRFFKMEVLAGEPEFVVEHHESNCRFIFDFSKVYWNSRLHTEHERLVQLFKPEDVIADVFAGVGPFAIPAAKRGCAVLANDLNPDSAHWLGKNIVANHVSDLVRSSCDDGREFIRNVVGRVIEEPLPFRSPRAQKRPGKRQREGQAAEMEGIGTYRNEITHFVMNLPDSAMDFLDAFRGILTPTGGKEGRLGGFYTAMPMVHCYCFTRELDPCQAEADIIQRAEARIESKLDKDVTLHKVRSVAPNKDMYCLSFRLPREAAFAP